MMKKHAELEAGQKILSQKNDLLLDELSMTQMRMVKYGTELSAEKKNGQEAMRIAKEAMRMATANAPAASKDAQSRTVPNEPFASDARQGLRALVAKKVAPYVSAEELMEVVDVSDEEDEDEGKDGEKVLEDFNGMWLG